MSPNLYMIGVLLASLFSWSAWALVLTRTDPYAGGSTALTWFYVTLFLALTGTFTIIGFYLRVWLKHNALYYQNVNVSFRQGALFSFAVCGLLALQSLRVLNWWDGLLVIAIIVMVEFAFLARGRESPM